MNAQPCIKKLPRPLFGAGLSSTQACKGFNRRLFLEILRLSEREFHLGMCALGG